MTVAKFPSSFPNFPFQTKNSCSKSTVEKKDKKWWLVTAKLKKF